MQRWITQGRRLAALPIIQRHRLRRTFVVMIIVLDEVPWMAWMVVDVLPILARSPSGHQRFLTACAASTSPASCSISAPTAMPRARRAVEEMVLATVMALRACVYRDVTAVHVAFDPDAPSEVERRWRSQFPGIPSRVARAALPPPSPTPSPSGQEHAAARIVVIGGLKGRVSTLAALVARASATQAGLRGGAVRVEQFPFQPGSLRRSARFMNRRPAPAAARSAPPRR
ncbi:MAG: hypothetical protein U0547_07120 [Dehalococcoidia bacterium]